MVHVQQTNQEQHPTNGTEWHTATNGAHTGNTLHVARQRQPMSSHTNNSQQEVATVTTSDNGWHAPDKRRPNMANCGDNDAHTQSQE